MDVRRAINVVLTLVLVLGLGGSAFAQATTTWTEHPANPVYSPGHKAYYPTVLKDGTTYMMWYASSAGVKMTTSSDGIAWGAASDCTGLTSANHPWVEKIGSDYRMWYWNTGQLYSIAAIRTAVSSDGITWTSDQAITQVGTSVVSGVMSWNRGSYGPADVIYNPAGSGSIVTPVDEASVWANKFVMYYDGTTGGAEDIGLAVSNNGLNWHGYNDGVAPVLAEGGAGQWDATYVSRCTVIKEDDDHYHMWYSGGDGRMDHGIGYASSSDGVNWARDAGNPIFHKTDGVAWRTDRTYCPAVVENKMLFSGKDGGGVYTIGLAQGPPSEVWVDDDYYDDDHDGGHDWGYDAFDNIQDGVNAVAGSTVHVADGTYNTESSPGSLKVVHITKDGLNLLGESRDGTIIDGSIFGASGVNWPKGIHSQANNVTIKNFTVQGFTGDLISTGGYGVVFRDYDHDQEGEGYVFYDGCHLENVKVQNCYSAIYALVHTHLTVTTCLVQNNLSDGMFIARGCDDATITNNTVANSGDHGIWVGKCWTSPTLPSHRATITGNTVNGARESGISFVGSDTATISNNEITNAKQDPAGWCVGALSLKDGVLNVTVEGNNIHHNAVPGFTCRGIGIDGASSNITIQNNNTIANSSGEGIASLGTTTTLTITSNTIMDNGATGLAVSATTTGVVAHLNNIVGNTNYGVSNAGTNVVDAENNWWGDASGPYHPSPPAPCPSTGLSNPSGLGDEVSNYVDYDPYRTTAVGVMLRPETAVITREYTAGSATFDFNAVIDNASDLAAFQFDALNDATSGVPMVTGAVAGSDWTSYNFDAEGIPYPNDEDGYRCLGDVDSGGVSFATGNVALLTVDYASVGAGTYTISLTNSEMVDSDADVISHNTQDLTVVIEAAGAPTDLHWVKVPTADSTTQISMEAEATDISGVEYQFEVDGAPQGWQGSGLYANSGLGINTLHSYRVQAQDLTPEHNTTGWLGPETCYTLAAVPSDGSLTPGVFEIAVTWLANGNPAGTTYKLYRNTGLVYTGTNTNYTDSGLNPMTSYEYTVLAVNGDAIETALHTIDSAYPLAAAPGAPVVNMTVLALNGPACRSLGLEGFDVSGNPVDVLFAIEVVGTGNYLHSDGTDLSIVAGKEWHLAADWVKRLRGLSPSTAYELKAIAKNGDDVEAAGGSATYTTNANGDVDRNGSCSVRDLILIRNAGLAGGTIGVDYSWATDIDDNRAANVADVQKARDIILGRE